MAGQAAEEAAGPRLLDLPDPLLLDVLSRLTLQERLCGVALACRTLCSLALAPPLVQSVHVVLWGGEDTEQRLSSLCRWLENVAAGHVRRFDLELGLPPTSQFDPAALQATLAGQPELQELRLALSGLTLPLGGWAAALPLRTLCIDQLAGPLLLEASLCWPPSLRALRLHGEPLQLRTALPETLTHLEIGWLQREWGLDLPRQVSELTGLRELELWGRTDQNSRDLETLSSLAQLTKLELRGYHDLAAILPLVPNLEELAVGALVNSTTADTLRRALEQTPRLTHLIGSDASDGNFKYLLEAMQGSTQLRLLSMSTFKELSEPSCHNTELKRMQAAAGIGPDLRIQLDCPPDVHTYWPDSRSGETSLPHEGLPGLPPALLALLQSACKFADYKHS
ncbi:F-box FBW2-like [Chlorella sorokiniana]|uniref:F-box FBW2-like n=1 Tax=Chlorella sorokiniana TaxID=3076 RepID=A0A2P6TRH9_CHLSO|nr:F-box FBW2-like [Chlorella sorokiniana]|eukprot:PRW56669.1 F-box FBW2-like [Chlorella sorokiniana]